MASEKNNYVISKPVPHPPLKLSQDEMARWNEDYHSHRESLHEPAKDIKEAEENLMKAMNENNEQAPDTAFPETD